jgi:hypothetical protein
LTAVARPKPLQRTRPGIAGHRIQAGERFLDGGNSRSHATRRDGKPVTEHTFNPQAFMQCFIVHGRLPSAEGPITPAGSRANYAASNEVSVTRLTESVLPQNNYRAAAALNLPVVAIGSPTRAGEMTPLRRVREAG